MSDMKTKRITAAEVLILFLVLGALAAISMPRMSHSATLSKDAGCRNNIELFNSAVELYCSDIGDFPSDLSKVTSNKNYFPVGSPNCPLGGTYILKSDHSVICTHP